MVLSQSNLFSQPAFFIFSTFFITSLLREFLNVVTFLEIFGSNVPMISAANIPAFFAAFKATVATGTPFGICKIERTESHPSMLLDDLIGTPMTGNGVIEAT